MLVHFGLHYHSLRPRRGCDSSSAFVYLQPRYRRLLTYLLFAFPLYMACTFLTSLLQCHLTQFVGLHRLNDRHRQPLYLSFFKGFVLPFRHQSTTADLPSIAPLQTTNEICTATPVVPREQTTRLLRTAARWQRRFTRCMKD